MKLSLKLLNAVDLGCINPGDYLGNRYRADSMLIKTSCEKYIDEL